MPPNHSELSLCVTRLLTPAALHLLLLLTPLFSLTFDPELDSVYQRPFSDCAVTLGREMEESSRIVSEPSSPRYLQVTQHNLLVLVSLQSPTQLLIRSLTLSPFPYSHAAENRQK